MPPRHEHGEDPFPAALGDDPGSVVGDRELPVVVEPVGADRDVRGDTGSGVLGGVGDQVLEHPLQLQGVGGDDGQRAEVEGGAGVGEGGLAVPGGGGGGAGAVHRVRWGGAGAGAGETEDGGDPLVHAFGAGGDVAEHFAGRIG